MSRALGVYGGAKSRLARITIFIYAMMSAVEMYIYIYGFICAPVIIYVTHIESEALLRCFVDLKDDDALKQVARGFVLFERCVLTKSYSKNANTDHI